MTERYHIRAVARMVAVLDAFSTQTPELGVAELAERLRLPKSTVHRFLVNLEAGGLLERVPRTGRYRLGLRLLELGGVVIGQMSLLEEAPPLLRTLADLSCETAALAVLDGSDAVVLETAQPGGPMRPVREPRPAAASALGRVLLAWGGGEEPGEPLLSDLIAVRARGCAVHHSGEGACGIAAPVRDHTGLVIAALGVEGPASRLGVERTLALAPVILDTARTLSRRLGAHRARDLAPRPRRVVSTPVGHRPPVLNGAGRAHRATARRSTF